MRKVYKIKNDGLLIDCRINEYDDIIKKRMMMFEEIKEYSKYLIIEESCSKYFISKEEIINGKIAHTDLYQLINNIISNIINDEETLYIHSSVIQNDDKTILVLGDFDSGKTTLSLVAANKGYSILSADQSILLYKNNNLNIALGSKYLKINGDEIIITNNDNLYKIDLIIELKGMCFNGDISIEKENNFDHYIKKVSKYCTWTIQNLLFSDNHDLNLNKLNIMNFIKKMSVPLYSVRGDYEKVLSELEKLK